jgi:hypothetical protein
MLHLRKSFLIGGMAVLVAVLALGVASKPNIPAEAHEGRQVGPYNIALGWVVEPAYAGVYNGVEVFISLAEEEHEEGEDEGEHQDGEAEAEHEHTEEVVAIEATLQVEVSYGGMTKILELEPVFDEVNHYDAAILPTRPGDYTFRLTGMIGETPVDETFTSADGEFSSIEPIGDVLFPEPDSSIEGLQAQINDLQALIAELQAQIAELRGE